MALLARDTVTWSRTVQGAPNALGQPTTTAAAGYPQSVIGHFQHKSASGGQSSAGMNQTISAVFYTDRLSTGKIGDTVTYDGVVYTVHSVKRSNDANGVLDHMKYVLVDRTTGDDPHGV